MENLIEGEVAPGQSVVVIEDLISTRKIFLKAVQGTQGCRMQSERDDFCFYLWISSS